jgi:hypothetical protein
MATLVAVLELAREVAPVQEQALVQVPEEGLVEAPAEARAPMVFRRDRMTGPASAVVPVRAAVRPARMAILVAVLEPEQAVAPELAAARLPPTVPRHQAARPAVALVQVPTVRVAMRGRAEPAQEVARVARVAQAQQAQLASVTRAA